MTETYDIVVVGGGTAGCFAAATVAGEGLDVVLLERKSEEEAGHIACGDAIKGKSTFPDVIDREYLKEESFQNQNIGRAVFENPHSGDDIDIPLGTQGAVLDRKRYGEVLLEEVDRVGVDLEYDTVVQDVLQQDGRVTGVRAKRRGEALTYEAGVVIDGAGALSILQDEADLGDATFDTNVTYSQFCSAYREIIEVDEPVEWEDALVFKPTSRAAGYLWYFPRTATEINAGLGFQMTEEPMELVDVLKRDLRSRGEFAGGEVTDKLGAALPTRRPYDSAIAPGFMAVGDAAGHVNPTTGGGIAGAAFAGQFAGEQAVRAHEEGTASEAALWRYNERVMERFGARYAGLDVYNVLSTAVDVDDLMGLLASLPGEKLAEALYEGRASMGLGLKLKAAVRSFGYWGTILDCYRTKSLAEAIIDTYESYPDSPGGLERWRAGRDDLMERVYETTGADPKY